MKQNTFFLVSQVLSVRHTNQTSKNVVDTSLDFVFDGDRVSGFKISCNIINYSNNELHDLLIEI